MRNAFFIAPFRLTALQRKQIVATLQGHPNAEEARVAIESAIGQYRALHPVAERWSNRRTRREINNLREQLKRDLTPTPKAIVKELTTVAERAGALKIALSNLSADAYGELKFHAARPFASVSWSALHIPLTEVLVELEAAAHERAIAVSKRVRRGRRPDSDLRDLVSCLVDNFPDGPTYAKESRCYKFVEAILAAVGIPSGNLEQMLRPIVKDRQMRRPGKSATPTKHALPSN